MGLLIEFLLSNQIFSTLLTGLYEGDLNIFLIIKTFLQLFFNVNFLKSRHSMNSYMNEVLSGNYSVKILHITVSYLIKTLKLNILSP